MTSTEFKKGLQSELNAAGLSKGNKIKKVGELGVNTFIQFTNPINDLTRMWLAKRFTYSASFPKHDDSLVLVNTPNDAKNTGITKGEWTISPAKNAIHCEGFIIANITDWISGYEANAKLICAAPELLECLKRCISELQCYDLSKETPPVIERSLKAIEKATK